MFRKSLIFLAIATICIFSFADGKNDPCNVNSCATCIPKITKAVCDKAKMMYVDRAQYCGCCNTCIYYLRKGEECLTAVANFITRTGKTISIKKQCAPGLTCGVIGCIEKIIRS